MHTIDTLLKKLIYAYSRNSRINRGKLFLEKLQPKSTDKILDLGSGTGNHFFHLIKPSKNVYISDINPKLLSIGKSRYGYKTIPVDAGKKLPFKNKHFDIVFCSSLIEHVTGDKRKIFYLQDKTSFEKYAYSHQRKLAKEIRRISKSYFVQTPYKFFPIEAHTWLPFFFILLPRWLLLRIIIFTNKYWLKKTYPDWNLLTIKQMKELFPDAEIILERSFGFVKSIMAIKKVFVLK